MKTKRRIAWLLSFLMVFSLIMGTSKMQVYADGVSGGDAGGEATFNVDFGTGSWTVGNETVTADKTGTQTLAETEVITLSNFNANTMEVRVSAEDGFSTTLTVTDNQTSLSTRDNAATGGLPGEGTLTFAVIEKSYGDEGNGGNEGEATFNVDFGTGSWTVGNETVTADKTGTQTLYESDMITLTGFDAETMEVRVIADDGFIAILTVTDNHTSLLTKDCESLPYPSNFTFAVVEKSYGDEGGNGGGEVEETFSIDFGTGSWTIGEATVIADKSGVHTLYESDMITLTGFDAETMEVRVIADDGFIAILTVTDNHTSLLTKDCESLPYPSNFTFAVVEKSYGDEGGNGGGEEALYTVDFGTGTWTFGSVTVMVAVDGVPVTGAFTISETDIIPLTNFDADTMAVWVFGADDFGTMLTVTDGQTSLATRDNAATGGLPSEGTLTFSVKRTVRNTTNSEENACKATFTGTNSELMESLLTEAEIAQVNNGADISVYMEVDDISNSVSDVDKDLISSVQGEATLGMYLDIDLFKQIGSNAAAPITETNSAVTITLEVPNSLVNSNANITRTYQMIRVHDGVTTIIPCDYDAASQKISFATDKFSTYALVYTDQQNSSGGVNTGGGNTGGGSNDNVKDVVPKTGDASNAYVWFMLALVSGIGALYFGKKGLVLKKEN